MKKKFIEPEIKRIELNLNENIASSDGYHHIFAGAFKVSHTEVGCLDNVEETWVPFYELGTTDRFEEVQKCFVVSKPEAARILNLPVTNDMY